jgi:ankyrin repeat protein
MDERFQPAQQVLAVGDVKGLASLLAADPGLATARSKRSHPTLLQCLVLTMPPVENLERLIDLLDSNGAELTGPLIAASGVDNLRAIRKLLDLGALIDGEGEGRWSPLEEALYWGNEAAVGLLLQRGAAAGNLRTFAALGDLEAVAHCFDESGSLAATAGEVAWPFNAVIPVEVRRDPRQIVGNALVFAAAWGRAEVVQFLLDHGAAVNMIPAGFDFAGTPLHYAALNGRREMVDHLLAHGADPAIQDAKISKFPEDWAHHDGHSDLVEHLWRARLQAN